MPAFAGSACILQRQGCNHKFGSHEEKENTTCDPCERNFERNIDRMVKAGEAPAEKTRREKEAEVKSAFAEEHPAAK